MGERWSGGKDLERQPLTVWIQGHQPYEDIRFYTNGGFPYLKDPRSKTLEPDYLSPHTFHGDTVSEGREGEGRRWFRGSFSGAAQPKMKGFEGRWQTSRKKLFTP